MRNEFPWVTTTCCGTHVLSLELKDMASSLRSPPSSRRCTWCSNSSGDVRGGRVGVSARPSKYKRSGLNFGLYRAKVTRFAGKFREMQRLLRVKEDLQGIVVTAEYARQKFSTRGRREEDLQDG